jgi:hypothetical protein
MSKARDLANFVSTGNPLADGTLAVADISDLTASAAEINVLDGVTASTAELNILDGVTADAAELNLLDGSSAGTVANSKAVIYDGSGGIVATQVDITATGDLRLQDTTGGQYVALQAPGTISSSFTLTLPAADGTSGQVLQTDGSGALSFATPAAGAWTLIAEQAITTGTSIYDFTGLSAYEIIRVLVMNRSSTNNGSEARVYCGLSTGSAAQNPRDDSYYTAYIRFESGSTAGTTGLNQIAVQGYAAADQNKPFHLDATIMNFGQSKYTVFNLAAHHSQSTYYGSMGAGYIDYSEAYDYIRVSINQATTGGNIIVLGVK